MQEVFSCSSVLKTKVKMQCKTYVSFLLAWIHLRLLFYFGRWVLKINVSFLLIDLWTMWMCYIIVYLYFYIYYRIDYYLWLQIPQYSISFNDIDVWKSDFISLKQLYVKSSAYVGVT